MINQTLPQPAQEFQPVKTAGEILQSIIRQNTVIDESTANLTGATENLKKATAIIDSLRAQTVCHGCGRMDYVADMRGNRCMVCRGGW